MVDGPQAEAPVERQRGLGGAEHGHPPPSRAGEGEEAGKQRLEGVRLADRVAGDDRDTADDAVGEERVVLLGEEVRLVRPQRERRQRVGAPR